MEPDRTFGDALRRYRRIAGLTQEQLAEAARLSVRGISDLERGARTAPHRETVALLADALRLSAQDRECLARAGGRGMSSMTDPPMERGRAATVAALTSFIGRERELADVRRLLGEARLVTLTGAGGCGKTRLALRLAEELAPGYADGAALVELASLTNPALVAPAVSLALGIREAMGRPLIATLVAALRERRLLLLLDNCEHLLDACAGLAETLLATSPDLRLLATSREPLLAAGEVVYRVPSLATPPLDRPLEPEELLRYDAARVFVDRARAALPSFAVTPRNAPAIALVCARLDGIALALELAAGRLRAVSLDELVARLDDCFRVLQAGNRAAWPRQQTLRATIDWSYSLLAAGERRLFARLSVFAGGFTLEAVEAVAGEETMSGPEKERRERGDDVLESLVRLVDKSMLLAEEQPDGSVRYRLLETLRQYAAERLAGLDPVALVRRRHAAYVVGLAGRAERPGPRFARWLTLLQAEQANVRAALDWCREQRAREWQARLVAGLGWYWMHLGCTSETRAWVEEALAQVASLGVHPLRAATLYGAALVAYDQRDLDASDGWLTESLELWMQLDDDYGVAWATLYLSQLTRDRGDFVAANTLAEQSLVRFRALGDAWAEGFTHTRLGMLNLATGDLEAARRSHEQGLTLFRALGDSVAVSTTLGYLGAVARARGDVPEAARLYGQALAMDQELPWTRGLAERLAPLAGPAAAAGQLGSAARLLGATAAQLRGIGLSRLLPSTHAAYERDLAVVRARLGEEAFARAAAEGARLTRPAAIAEALALARRLAMAPARASPSGPSAREAELLRLLARGHTNREIAQELDVSVKAVERQVGAAFARLGVRNRAEAVAHLAASGPPTKADAAEGLPSPLS